jgi:membrane associated rhomboid family serine protease
MASLRLKKEDVGAFTQLYVLLSVIIFIVSQQSLFFASFFISPTNVLSSEPFSLSNPWHYLRLFFHPFGHHSVLALCANAAFLFFLSPLVEKKILKTYFTGNVFYMRPRFGKFDSGFFSKPHSGWNWFYFFISFTLSHRFS